MKNNKEYTKIKNIFIIGNGFDLHHGVKTSFNDFKEYFKNNHSSEFESFNLTAKNMLNEKLDDWNKLENYIGELVHSEGDNIYKNIEEDYHDLNDFYKSISPSYEYLDMLKNNVTFLKKVFFDWINIKNNEILTKDKFNNVSFNKEDYFIIFNYTNTLESLYGIDNNHILHIHGKSGNDLILGHNEDFIKPFPKTIITYDENYNEKRVRLKNDEFNTELIEKINKYEKSLHSSFNKRSKRIISRNKKWFEHFKNINSLSFYGFGFGNQDALYINKIVDILEGRNNKNLDINIYYYDEKDKKEKKEAIEKYFKNFSNIKLLHRD